jgi:hypothetical protein
MYEELHQYKRWTHITTEASLKKGQLIVISSKSKWKVKGT